MEEGIKMDKKINNIKECLMMNTRRYSILVEEFKVCKEEWILFIINIYVCQIKRKYDLVFIFIHYLFIYLHLCFLNP